MAENVLYYGDNLDILRRYIKDESVDLVYLDPPFKSNKDYNVLFEERNGSRSKAQIKAFEDTWRWDTGAAQAYQDIVENGPGTVSRAMQAFRTLLGENDMLAYLAMMAPRLVELRRVLKPTGSIYLHCDPTASAHLRLLMDAVFGAKNFRNEIIWCYSIGGRSKRAFGRKHDTIFWYSRSDKWTFAAHDPELRVPRKPDSHMKVIVDDEGVQWQEKTDRQTGKVYRYRLDKVPEDYWTDIEQLNREAAERLGYPTQKPEALLERIIRASSNEGDVVLDPFCGCGTAVVVAERLKRRWIGIDITHLAITLVKHRLRDTFPDKITEDGHIRRGVEYEVIGEPVALSGATALAAQDPYQFQLWALGLVGARPAEQKRGADRGIDGRLYFHDEKDTTKTKQIILQVKAGHTGVKDVRELIAVVEREKAQIGVLISLQEPTRAMRAEAASAGFYAPPLLTTSYPRIQLLTVGEILEGKQIQYPYRISATFKKAPKARGNPHRQLPLKGAEQA